MTDKQENKKSGNYAVFENSALLTVLNECCDHYHTARGKQGLDILDRFVENSWINAIFIPDHIFYEATGILPVSIPFMLKKMEEAKQSKDSSQLEQVIDFYAAASPRGNYKTPEGVRVKQQTKALLHYIANHPQTLIKTEVGEHYSRKMEVDYAVTHGLVAKKGYGHLIDEYCPTVGDIRYLLDNQANLDAVRVHAGQLFMMGLFDEEEFGRQIKGTDPTTKDSRGRRAKKDHRETPFKQRFATRKILLNHMEKQGWIDATLRDIIETRLEAYYKALAKSDHETDRLNAQDENKQYLTNGALKEIIHTAIYPPISYLIQKGIVEDHLNSWMALADIIKTEAVDPEKTKEALTQLEAKIAKRKEFANKVTDITHLQQWNDKYGTYKWPKGVFKTLGLENKEINLEIPGKITQKDTICRNIRAKIAELESIRDQYCEQIKQTLTENGFFDKSLNQEQYKGLFHALYATSPTVQHDKKLYEIAFEKRRPWLKGSSLEYLAHHAMKPFDQPKPTDVLNALVDKAIAPTKAYMEHYLYSGILPYDDASIKSIAEALRFDTALPGNTTDIRQHLHDQGFFERSLTYKELQMIQGRLAEHPVAGFDPTPLETLINKRQLIGEHHIDQYKKAYEYKGEPGNAYHPLSYGMPYEKVLSDGLINQSISLLEFLIIAHTAAAVSDIRDVDGRSRLPLDQKGNLWLVFKADTPPSRELKDKLKELLGKKLEYDKSISIQDKEAVNQELMDKTEIWVAENGITTRTRPEERLQTIYANRAKEYNGKRYCCFDTQEYLNRAYHALTSGDTRYQYYRLFESILQQASHSIDDLRCYANNELKTQEDEKTYKGSNDISVRLTQLEKDFSNRYMRVYEKYNIPAFHSSMTAAHVNKRIARKDLGEIAAAEAAVSIHKGNASSYQGDTVVADTRNNNVWIVNHDADLNPNREKQNRSSRSWFSDKVYRRHSDLIKPTSDAQEPPLLRRIHSDLHNAHDKDHKIDVVHTKEFLDTLYQVLGQKPPASYPSMRADEGFQGSEQKNWGKRIIKEAIHPGHHSHK